MEMATTSSGADPAMVNKIASHLKSQGIFDQFRRNCLEDVDTKPAYQNLRQKVENYVSSFLSKVTWDPTMNKNQLRDSLRRQINQSEMLSTGVERIIEQVIEPKMQHVFRPQIEKVVDEFLNPEGTIEADTVKKDLASTSGWQDTSHQSTAPAPPDLPPEVPTPAPPLPPSEPPAAPPQAPPEAPPDSPPQEPHTPLPIPQDPPKTAALGTPSTSPVSSSGNSTPSAANTLREAPGLAKKPAPQLQVDVKIEKKPLEDLDEKPNKFTQGKPQVIKSEPAKSQPGKSLPSKDQNVKKILTKETPVKTQASKIVKKLSPALKPAENSKTSDKLQTIPSKSILPKSKLSPDIKKDDQGTIKQDLGIATMTQTTVKKPQLESEIKPPSAVVEIDKKLKLSDTKSSSKLEPKRETKSLKPTPLDTQEIKTGSRSTTPVSVTDEPSLTKTDTVGELNMDREMTDVGNVEMASKGDESDGESGLSDISVSSVNTSDLSSFDEDISSTSTSSSDDSSSEEEAVPKHISPKKKKRPIPTSYPSDSDMEIPSEETRSTDTSRPASAASDRLPGKKSPKTQPPSSRALAISRYHGDSEDEDSRQERRKKAASDKEERARRRQQAKEEHEKMLADKREKMKLASQTVQESTDTKKAPKKEEAVTASPQKATKKQLKEQKMLEKKREIRRRRSLNKRYFSDEFTSSMQGLKKTVSQQESSDDIKQEQPEPPKQEDIARLRALFRREKQQCFHLVYRERKEPRVKYHHLLAQGISGEQQKKLSNRKQKERRDSKVMRFAFHAKSVAGASSEGSKKSRPNSRPTTPQPYPQQDVKEKPAEKQPKKEKQISAKTEVKSQSEKNEKRELKKPCPPQDVKETVLEKQPIKKDKISTKTEVKSQSERDEKQELKQPCSPQDVKETVSEKQLEKEEHILTMTEAKLLSEKDAKQELKQPCPQQVRKETLAEKQSRKEDQTSTKTEVKSQCEKGAQQKIQQPCPNQDLKAAPEEKHPNTEDLKQSSADTEAQSQSEESAEREIQQRCPNQDVKEIPEERHLNQENLEQPSTDAETKKVEQDLKEEDLTQSSTDIEAKEPEKYTKQEIQLPCQEKDLKMGLEEDQTSQQDLKQSSPESEATELGMREKSEAKSQEDAAPPSKLESAPEQTKDHEPEGVVQQRPEEIAQSEELSGVQSKDTVERIETEEVSLKKKQDEENIEDAPMEVEQCGVGLNENDEGDGKPVKSQDGVLEVLKEKNGLGKLEEGVIVKDSSPVAEKQQIELELQKAQDRETNQSEKCDEAKTAETDGDKGVEGDASSGSLERKQTPPTKELSTDSADVVEQASAPEELTAEGKEPVISGVSQTEPSSSDDIDNPPTPTQDEPSIYSDVDSESEEQSDKSSSIPIYTVHSPKRLALVSVFNISQSPLKDLKNVTSAQTEKSDESASEPVKETTVAKDTTESSTDDSGQGLSTAVNVSESHRKSSSSESTSSSQQEHRYGTRPKRHTVSPRDSFDDDYYYYGQAKRSRYSHSPVSHQEESSKAERSRARRASADCGKTETTERPTRRQRHVSPPRRYSPSDDRSTYRSTTSSSHALLAPALPAKPRPSSSPLSHEHFTRRSSSRDDTKRSNRYSDMYYYGDRGSRNQASTKSGDREKVAESVSSRRASRRSLDDRVSSQPSSKRRK